jgi:acylphosphatase
MADQTDLPERRIDPPPLLVHLGTVVAMILMLVGIAPSQVSAASDAQQQQAISATVTGNDQHVGFRAMIMKQAIKYNLAGSAKNEADGTVHFTLQGDSDRLDSALAAIREGTKKSSNIKVSTTPAAVDRGLDTFTIVDWTSTSRNITTPYTLVFTLRAHDKVISKSDAKDVWHKILRTTLRGEDLQKLQDDD